MTIVIRDTGVIFFYNDSQKMTIVIHFFEQNGNPFGSKSKEKLSPRSYPIQYERKKKYSFLSVVHKIFSYSVRIAAT